MAITIGEFSEQFDPPIDTEQFQAAFELLDTTKMFEQVFATSEVVATALRASELAIMTNSLPRLDAWIDVNAGIFDGGLPNMVAEVLDVHRSARSIAEAALGDNMAGILQAARAASNHHVSTALSDEFASTVARIQATMPTVEWADVIDARSTLVGSVQDLSQDADEVLDLTEPVTETSQEPLSRSDKIALAILIFTVLGMQDDIVRNARYDVQLIEKAIASLLEYLATLAVWTSELPPG